MPTTNMGTVISTKKQRPIPLVTFEFPDGNIIVPVENATITIRIPNRVNIIDDLKLYTLDSGNAVLPPIFENETAGEYELVYLGVTLSLYLYEDSGNTFLEISCLSGTFGEFDGVGMWIVYGDIQNQYYAYFGWAM
jgi:hypothetical protein